MPHRVDSAKLSVYSQLTRVTDRRTDRQTDGNAISIAVDN